MHITRAMRGIALGAVVCAVGMAGGQEVEVAAAPLVHLEVFLVGEGKVTPPPGDYPLGAEVSLAVEAAPGWRFMRWSGDEGESANPRVVKMDAPQYLAAVVVERPESFNLNLAADLALLLHAAEITPSPELADAAGYDMGGEGRDESPAPDGIPDFVQFKLLQALLEDAGFDATPFGGVSNKQVSAAWEKNVMRARKDMPEAAAGIQNAIAAYMTFATDPFMALAKELALKATGVTLNSDLYMQRDLALEAEADPDGDGLWNRLEWRHIAGDAPANLEHADAFVKAALDRKAPDRTTVDIGIDLADGDGEDWNYDHLPHCTITFRQEKGLPIDARILDPPGREDVPLPVDTPVSVPLGAEIIVTLGREADADWFYTWEAPGHMIDGRGEKTERFRTMRDGFVHPVRRPVLPFQLPESQGAYQWEWRGVGPLGRLVRAGESWGGDRFAVPIGAFLQVAAYRSAPEGYKEYAMTWRGAFGNAETFQVCGARLPLFVAAVASLEPDFDAPPLSDYSTHCFYTEEGGAVVVGGGMLTMTGDPRLYLTHWERLITARPAPDDETKYPLPRSVIPWPGYEVKL